MSSQPPGTTRESIDRRYAGCVDRAGDSRIQKKGVFDER